MEAVGMKRIKRIQERGNRSNKTGGRLEISEFRTNKELYKNEHRTPNIEFQNRYSVTF